MGHNSTLSYCGPVRIVQSATSCGTKTGRPHHRSNANTIANSPRFRQYSALPGAFLLQHLFWSPAMLTINGAINRSLCDGIPRRRFLEIGGLSAFGLSLPDLLRAEQQDAGTRSKRSVILIWMHGGPSQLDTFDMKPLAPGNTGGLGNRFRPVCQDWTSASCCRNTPK